MRAAIDDLGCPEGAFKLASTRDLPPVRADAAQLERAFANLLENAYRHSGGHPVSVRARDVGGRILLRVVDRGPGIPQAQRERVFEPFYRSGTERTGHRGSGLGLAIVRGFVEANGGRVWVESLPGQATSFVVELPVEHSEVPADRLAGDRQVVGEAGRRISTSAGARSSSHTRSSPVRPSRGLPVAETITRSTGSSSSSRSSAWR